MTWNVRGLTRPGKRRKIKVMIKDEGIDVVLLQETKKSSMEEEFIKQIWSFEKMEFMGADTEGTTGGGDFNEITYISERNGCSRMERGMTDFNGLIDQLSLVDLPMLGRSFTWCNDQDGERWSRIDRFLLDSRWFEEYLFKQWGLPKSISDHCPVLLKECKEGSKKSSVNLSRRKGSLWHQKSRMVWAKCGDKNTRFFHMMASSRQRKNMLDSVVEGGSENDNLVVAFTEQEIWEAIHDYDGNKAPRLDGFNMACIQKCWKIMKSETLQFLTKFHENGKLVLRLNNSFITLIPKKENPSDLGDYRPISLVNLVYKILAKVLSKRLKKVMPSMISEVHKLGISFFNDDEFWFWGKMVKWIKTFISSAKISVLVNGSPSAEFVPQKGLRQGDLLSPFLFHIAAEGLNLLIKRAKKLGYLRGATIEPTELMLSHLQFANNIVIFCAADRVELVNIKRILRCFELMSGLKINFHKSVLSGVGVNEEDIKDFVSVLHCHSQKLPITYFGANPRRKSTWKPVIEKVKKKLASWKGKMLSFARIITLIKWTGVKFSKVILRMWKVVPLAVLWSLCKAMNDGLFSGKPIDWIELAELVKRMVGSLVATTVLGMSVVLVFLVVYEERCITGELLWYCYCYSAGWEHYVTAPAILGVFVVIVPSFCL
ncbi:uncharacterized protein LOC114313894 [Camellia sinensis]|uniref:uncharacterized protein LOC114313894 n=1 Tax=Camellia sinensis TaxID=4442 RepID=UPI0010361C88|nr:uncharacterized protein LOC114313894 [Camellia sinensis]